MSEQFLLVNEVFRSIQGESTWVGKPCTFVRLKGCPLRCRYCDTSYAFHEGHRRSIQDVIDEVLDNGDSLVEVTGGEPLIHPQVHPFMKKLCDLGLQVLLETSGERDIQVCDPRIIRIIDIKTPNSGAGGSFLYSNIDDLRQSDEIKFVIIDREDFDWALQFVQEYNLLERVHAVHFSPVMEQAGNEHIQGCDGLEPVTLAQWILESGSAVRFHLQVHKYIWPPDKRGV